MKQIQVLDGIRGLAILLVMTYHFSISFQQEEHFSQLDSIIATIFQMGWIGVDLFFVMSGFLITSILYTSTDHKNYFKNFYIRRFLRIFPLYYAVLFALLVIAPQISSTAAEKTIQMREESIWFLSYLVNWRIAEVGGFSNFQSGYMWSLAVEEQFYVVWPFLVLFFKRRLALLCFSLIVIFAVLRLYLLMNGTKPGVVYVMTFTHLDGLLLGSALAVLKIDGHLTAKVKRLLYAASILAIVCFFAVFMVSGKFVYYTYEVAAIGLLVISIIFSGLLIRTIDSPQGSYLQSLFSSRFLMLPGKLCYGLYLLHQPIGVLVSDKLMSHDAFMIGDSRVCAAVVNIVISMSISFIAALISYHLFEKHFLKLKERFS